MPFLFSCPHCQTKTRVEDRYSGQAGECVTCGGKIKIPLFTPTGDGTAVAKKSTSFTWMVAAGVMLVIAGCLIFAVLRFGGQTVQRLSNNRSRNSSMKNLQKIASALNAYAEEYGTYPPPMTVDKNKLPLHSWRVLILPYLGEDDLYGKFDLNKPWDDPVNMAHAYSMPNVFRHPEGAKTYYTPESDYYLVIGNGTLFPNGGPLGPKDVTDSSTQTLLVVTANPDVMSAVWIEPIDIEFAKMSGQINGPSKHDVGQILDDGVTMATVDGRSHFLPDSTSSTILNALISPQGNEPLSDDTLD